MEYAAKPATTIALLAAAASLDVTRDGQWAWLLAALVFCLAGDVFLMLPCNAFVPGLASFAVAQILLTVSFVVSGFVAGRLVGGVVLAVPVSVLLARRFVGALRRSGHDDLVLPVGAYVTVISAMAVASIGAGSVVAIAGALLFLLSDSLIAESRFVRARSWHPVGIMVTYHLALAGLVLGLV